MGMPRFEIEDLHFCLEMGRKVWIVWSFLALTTVGSWQFSIKSPPERNIAAPSDDRTRHNSIIGTDKKLSYRRETARQLHTSFWAHSLIVHFTEHRICFYSASA